MTGLIAASKLNWTGDVAAVMLDPAWNIWGPAGGYIASIAMNGVRARAAEGHRQLTITGQFVSVARPGSINVHVAEVKGGGTALFAVSLFQEDRTVFLGHVWTTRRADESLPLAPTMPAIARPDALASQELIMAERGVALAPFWQNLEGRPANFRLAGDPPAEDARQYRWMRFREWAETDDPFQEAMRQLLLIDIGIWPAHWHRQPRGAEYRAPSLDIWANFHDPRPAGDWLLSDADADVCGHGAISGRVRIWSEDGRALATGGGQCLVVAPKLPPG